MTNYKIAVKKDKILQFLLTQPNGTSNISISEELFKNETGETEVTVLLNEMVKDVPLLFKIIETRDGVAVHPNDLTKKYAELDNFFTSQVLEIAVTNLKKGEKDKFEKEIVLLQKKNLEQKVKTHWMPIAISIISLVFAAYSLLKPTNNVPPEQYDTKIESIEKELQQLRIDFKQENEELKDRLYKAEMLIAIYEDEVDTKE